MDKIQQHLLCPICLENMRRPKLLPCQHRFCLKCLEKLNVTSNRFPCPECRSNHDVPASGMSGFPTCRLTEGIIEAIAINHEGPNAVYSGVQADDDDLYQIELMESMDEESHHTSQRFLLSAGRNNKSSISRLESSNMSNAPNLNRSRTSIDFAKPRNSLKKEDMRPNFSHIMTRNTNQALLPLRKKDLKNMKWRPEADSENKVENSPYSSEFADQQYDWNGTTIQNNITIEHAIILPGTQESSNIFDRQINMSQGQHYYPEARYLRNTRIASDDTLPNTEFGYSHGPYSRPLLNNQIANGNAFPRRNLRYPNAFYPRPFDTANYYGSTWNNNATGMYPRYSNFGLQPPNTRESFTAWGDNPFPDFPSGGQDYYMN